MRSDGTCRIMRHKPACLRTNVKIWNGTIEKKSKSFLNKISFQKQRHNSNFEYKRFLFSCGTLLPSSLKLHNGRNYGQTSNQRWYIFGNNLQRLENKILEIIIELNIEYFFELTRNLTWFNSNNFLLCSYKNNIL